MTQTILAHLGVYAGMYVIGLVAGLVPVIPVEIVLGAVVVVAGNFWLALAIAVLAGAGQMTAKAILYQGAQRATKRSGEPKPGSKLYRAKQMMERWRDKPLALTFVSGLVGIPPLVLFAPLAGVLGVRFRAFMAFGMAGRSLRFVVIAMITLTATR